MFTFLLVIHILICLLLVVVVLLQSGKGGGLASAFGGAGTTEAVFGGRQASSFLIKATRALGLLFFLMTFVLALLSSYAEGPRSAVQEQLRQGALPMVPAPVAQPVGGDMLEGAAPVNQDQQAQPGNETPAPQP